MFALHCYLMILFICSPLPHLTIAPIFSDYVCIFPFLIEIELMSRRNYGVPLHLIRELYETFRNFRIRIADYVRYRKITSNMNDRFPDATAEELDA